MGNLQIKNIDIRMGSFWVTVLLVKLTFQREGFFHLKVALRLHWLPLIFFLEKTKEKLLLTRFGFVRRWAGWEGFCTQSQPQLSPARRRGFWKANRLFWFGWNFWKRTITMKMTKTLSTIDHLCSEESPSKRLASIQVVSSGYSTNLPNHPL